MSSPLLFGTSNVTSAPLSVYGISTTWTGWDGSSWDLTDYAPGRLAMLADGFTGLLWPEFSSQVTVSPAMDGQRLQGVSALPRVVEFLVHIRGVDSPDFTDLFSRFTRSWSPSRTGVLTVTVGTHTRSIRLRLNPTPDALPRDPVFKGRTTIVVSAIADDPYWLADWVDGDWSDDDEVRDFLSDQAGYLLWISPSQTLATATMTNPGDVPAWPVWTVTATLGTLTGTITVDGGTIGLPSIPAGKTAVIDTDPARGYADMGALISGVFTKESEVDGLLNPYDPRPLPVGRDVPIGFNLSAPGRVTARLRARHWLGIGDA